MIQRSYYLVAAMTRRSGSTPLVFRRRQPNFAATPNVNIQERLELRQGDADLSLILTLLIAVRHLGRLAPLEEEDLRDALVRVDLRGEGRRVRDLERHKALPLRLERCDVRDDTAACIRRFAHGDRHDVAWNAEVLDRPGQRERIGRHDAHVPLELDE